jgi:hypothetical protein
MGGTDISMGTISNAMAGYKDVQRIAEAKRAYMAGNKEALSTVNAVNLLGWSGTGKDGIKNNETIAKALWSGELEAVYEQMESGSYGRFDQGNSNQIFLSNEFLGLGSEKSAKLATVMSHEGSHWGGNRVEGIAQLQGLNTYNTINGMFGLRSDAGFASEMISAMNNPRSWMKNTGSSDYWKVIRSQDGSIKYEWDNTHALSFIGFEEENEIAKTLKGKEIHTLTDAEKTSLLSMLAQQKQQITDAEKQALTNTFNQVQNVTKTRMTLGDMITQKGMGGKKGYDDDDLSEAFEAFSDALIALRANPNAVNLIDIPVSNKTTLLLNGHILPFETNGKFTIQTLFGDRESPDDAAKMRGLIHPNAHEQIDTTGIGQYLSFNEGTLSLRWADSWGLRAKQVDKDNNYTDIGHMTVGSLDTWIGLSMGDKTTVSKSGSGISITGIPQGAILGTMGNTGYSFGPHGDIQFGKKNKTFDPLSDYFPTNGILEGKHFTITPHARAYSGLPAAEAVRNGKSLQDTAVASAFSQLITLYDTYQNGKYVPEKLRNQNWNLVMEYYNKNNYAFAQELYNAYQNSSIVKQYFLRKQAELGCY